MSLRLPSWGIAATVAALVLAMLAAWRFTPLGELADPQQVAAQIQNLARSPWAPLTLALIYVAANVVMFPIVVLNLALILTLGAGPGTVYALYGTVLSGVLVFLIGARFGRPLVHRLDNARVNRAMSLVRGSGLPGLVLIRLVPVAPYPVVNLVLGAGGIGLWTFALGTIAGVLPGLLLLGLLGFQLRRVIEAPDAAGVSVLAALAVAIAVLATWVKRRLAARFDRPAER